MATQYVLDSFFQAFLSSGIQMLLDRIASSDVVSFITGKKDSDFPRLVKELEMMMSTFTGVLDDAEQRQMRDDKRVEAWLDAVQEAVFDAEDVLAEIEYEALRLKVTGDSGAGSSEVRESKRRKIFSFSHNSKDRDLKSAITNILHRLEELAEKKGSLGLNETLSEKKQWKRLPSTCLVEESQIFGRDSDRDALIKLLLSDDNCGSEMIGVIPIVGIGGVGKTTLAQTLFNHSQVKEHFDLMLWVCVSENYDVHKTTCDLLSSSGGDGGDLNSLQLRLREKLARKKFFIVLDDVWNEKAGDWEVMRMPFKDGAQGSKIVVTTRSQEVARITGTVPFHNLDVLTDEDSWKLFVKRAFGDNLDKKLEKIGKEIVKKCKGLPLAVKTLAGLLHSDSNIDHWKGILASEIWDLTESQSDILPALRLSYHYLHSHLKRCFAYCAIFPKGYRIEKEKLILLWMAQGLIERPQGSMVIEEVGDQYFNVLLSMSFFQPSRLDYQAFVMHDLMVDLATHVYRKYCFRLEGKICDDIARKETARHVAYIDDDDADDKWEKFNSIFKASHVRTLMALDYLSLESPCVSKREVRGFFSKAKYLRVLYFTKYHQRCGVPIDSICQLRHLRFLKLTRLFTEHLPDSLCTLHDLQTLICEDCEFLSKLPENFHHLVSLRYLDVSLTRLKELPESLSLLPNLQKLIIRFCRNLSKLPNNFGHLINLRYLDAHGSGLKELPESLSLLPNLQKLIIRFCRNLSKLPNNFGHLINLRYLDAHDSGLKELPESLSLLPNLETLNLQECRELKMLPREFHHLINLSDLNVSRTGLEELPESISQLHNLQVLKLSWCSKLQKLPESFHLLTNLRSLIVDGSGLEELPESISQMHNLQVLNLSWCSKLQKLPESFHLLTNLRSLIVDGSGLEELPESISQLHNLQVLNLSQCSKLQKLPESFHLFTNLRSLRVDGSGLKEMPTQIFEAKNLQNLSAYVVGENRGAEIRELGNLQNLRGRLCIKNLQNVVNPEDALEVKLREKKHLDNLELEWSSRHSNDGPGELGVLNNLVPPASLVKLKIRGYGGTTFSDWLTHHLCNIVTLTLLDCINCANLPPLGQLASLKKLEIGGFDAVVKVGLEFYGTSSSKPFASLEDLSFRDMPQWKEWTMLDGDRAAFPKLTRLGLYRCNSLEGEFRCLLRSVTQLGVSTCEDIFSIHKLERSHARLGEGFVEQSLASQQRLTIAGNSSTKLGWSENVLPNLTSLSLSGCKELKFLPENMRELFPVLNKLHIESCDELESFPTAGLPLTLRSLTIERCAELESFPTSGLPLTLLSLYIERCEKLVASRRNWNLQALPNLQIFKIRGYSGGDMESFPEQGLLPTTLTDIEIWFINSLKSVNNKELQQLTSLKQLQIFFCPNLETMGEEPLPGSLQWLHIRGCPVLSEKLERETGGYWNLISHIKTISDFPLDVIGFVN